VRFLAVYKQNQECFLEENTYSAISTELYRGSDHIETLFNSCTECDNML